MFLLLAQSAATSASSGGGDTAQFVALILGVTNSITLIVLALIRRGGGKTVAIDKRVTAQGTTLTEHGQRLTEHTARLDEQDGRLGDVEGRIDEHDKLFEKNEPRLAKLEQHRETQITSDTAIQVSLARVQEGLTYIKLQMEQANGSRRK